MRNLNTILRYLFQQQPGGQAIGDLSITQALGMARDQVKDGRTVVCALGFMSELFEYLIYEPWYGVM